MKRKLVALMSALALTTSLLGGCGANTPSDAQSPKENEPKKSGATDIVIMVPNADHGWTGAVMTLAEEKAEEINSAGTYSAKVITSTDAQNQISQVEDLIENKSANAVVILPQDNQLEATMKKLADSEIDFVMFDRIIDTVSDAAVSCVKGDNEGIGKATAARFVEKGFEPGDKILIMPGDNSSVPEMRNNGFFTKLKENGWTDDQISAMESTDFTGWSRSKGKELFTSWLDSHTVDEIKQYEFIFTHDDEIAMGILEALKSSDIDPGKKEAFLSTGVHISSSSGLNEIYSVYKGIHQKDYSKEFSQLAGMFSVTYDPAMIQTATQDMLDYLDGKEVAKDHVVPVDVVDSTNAEQFNGFGAPVSK